MEGISSDEGSTESYCSLSLQLLKESLAVVHMKQLHKAFFTEISQGRFTKPQRLQCTSSKQKLSSGSTTDSQGDSSEPRPSGGSVEEWKVNLITTLLLSYEERCKIENVLDDHGLRMFRSMNRGLLGKVLENIEEFRSQKYSGIACSILMINASKMKIPKEQFTSMLSQMDIMTRLNLTSINAIKKSKVFSLIKRITKCW